MTRPLQAREIVALAAFVVAACAPPIRPVVAPDGPPIEFWQEPVGRDDLFYGVGGRDLAPRPSEQYRLLKRDPSGFSTTLDVKDQEGEKWDAKLGPEAQSEVTVSRIVWAMGYPQPPIYYLPDLVVEEHGRTHREGHARMRANPDWIDKTGIWSWHQNPYVGTPQYRGLLVLMMVLNSTDLKDDNNAVYEVSRHGKTERWHVVKDLGASLGETGKLNPKRSDVEAFEREGFIRGVDDEGHVQFVFHGRHGELLDRITPADVRWMCTRLSRLSAEQWREAFRAGGYDRDESARYVRKIKDKIAQGLALASPKETR